jgi:hypothetical protein
MSATRRWCDEQNEAGAVNGPCAGEVVVGRDGEWHSALVLRHSGDRYLIHTCPGHDGAEMSDNEWVQAGRVRFPASSSVQDGSIPDSADRAEAFGDGQWCVQPPKPPVPAEV